MLRNTGKLIILIVCGIGIWAFGKIGAKAGAMPGDRIDSLNGVYVYENGKVSNTFGRNVADDGYNLGLKYQCVEFVKRYYYFFLSHKMPDTYGDAKDFFDPALPDGRRNKRRNLIQYRNSSNSKPEVNDILVWSPSLFNKHGHVAVISKVNDTGIEVVQQNAGWFSGSRETYPLTLKNGKWIIDNGRIMGWLRK